MNLKAFLRKVPFARAAWSGMRKRINHVYFYYSYLKFKQLPQLKQGRLPMRWMDRQLCLEDRTKTTGFDGHYVYHTAWAARVLARTKPAVHTDISSYIYFCALVSAFIPVKFYDYRPARLKLDNLSSEAADLSKLPFEDNSVNSLSCMHVIEHVGLGRYGDPLDPDGDLKAIAEIKRVLAPSGSLIFAVPIGKPRIMFNAHRIYSYDQIIDYFSGMKIKEFALIPDNHMEVGLIYDATREMADSQNYACGCFWFMKEPC